MMKFYLTALMALIFVVSANASCSIEVTRVEGTFETAGEWGGKKAYFSVVPDMELPDGRYRWSGVSPASAGVTASFSNPDGAGTLILAIDSASSSCADVVLDLRYENDVTMCKASTIILNDAAAPVFSYTPDHAIDMSCADVGTHEDLSATDDTTFFPVVDFSESASGGTVESGTYLLTRTWTATDNCARTTVFTQTIMVKDLESPTLEIHQEDGSVSCDRVPLASECDITALDK